MKRVTSTRSIPLFIGIGVLIISVGLLLLNNRPKNSAFSCAGCNVVVIDINLLRSDAISCDTNPERTPNICNILTNSFSFLNHYSHSRQTKTSFASFLTSLNVRSHGIWGDTPILDPSIATLPTILNAHNYTSLFIGNEGMLGVNPSDFGFGLAPDGAPASNANQKVIPTPSGSTLSPDCDTLAISPSTGAKTPTDSDMVARATARISGSNQPFFLYYITYNLHFPYINAADQHTKPSENTVKHIVPTTWDEFNTSFETYLLLHYKEVFTDEAIRLNPNIFQSFPLSTHDLRHLFNTYNNDQTLKTKYLTDSWIHVYKSFLQQVDFNNPAHIAFIMSRYYAALTDFDEKIGPLLRMLEQQKYKDNTILIVKSPHGEEFGEHGNFSHQNNHYQELIHVPVYIKLPSPLKGMTQSLTEDIDLVPTILDLVKIPIPKKLQGKSLLSVMDNPGSQVHSSLIAWEGEEQIAAFIKDKWKLMFTNKIPTELYDLVGDPGEKQNLINTKPNQASLLEREYNRVVQSIPPVNLPQPPKNTIDEEKRKRMIKEGYF